MSIFSVEGQSLVSRRTFRACFQQRLDNTSSTSAKSSQITTPIGGPKIQIRRTVLDAEGRSDSRRKPKLDPIHEFFAAYPKFTYNPRAHHVDEFWRLYNSRPEGWPRRGEERIKYEDKTEEQRENSKRFREAKKAFHRAQARAFGQSVGTKVDDLKSWKKLCAAAGLKPKEETLEGYKKVIGDAYINLCDLHNYIRQVEAGRRNTKRATLFDSLNALRGYTKSTEKFFPKEGTIMDRLRRKILDWDPIVDGPGVVASEPKPIPEPVIRDEQHAAGDGVAVDKA
ncbi:hypothetical protein BJ508DRAFT_325844 [Ascobolus immersus RN42]|uniref:Uncharacterized protein n=1 Tax=Ascobolus immersus RN42 TaxID=1160509 RepID=A0A3N4I7M8_ASCIM|nr:hypothetical protein BJ508DRAFT_325844 [Ascobolus immersus RN42]